MGRLFIRNTEVATSEEFNPTFSYNILDVTNPMNKQASFSKTIKIPSTKEINILFDNIFNIGTSLTTFNPNKKETAIYYSNETELFVGYVRLINIDVNLEKDITFYTVELYGDLSSLFMDIGERLVTGNANPSDDIDFSEWNHELKKENVVNSWATSNIKNGTPVGLVGGEGYRYALIDFGKGQDLATQQGISYDQEKDFDVVLMRPVIFRYELLKKIFAKAGWTWSSSFLENTFFKTICHPSNVDKLYRTQSDIDNNRMYVQDTTTPNQVIALSIPSGTTMTMLGSSFPAMYPIHDDESTPFYDVGGMNNITTGEFTTPLQESYTITYQCRMYVQKQSSVPSGAAIVSIDGYLRMSLEREVSPSVWVTQYYEDQPFNQVSPSPQQDFQFTTTVYNVAGTKYRISLTMSNTTFYFSLSMTSASVRIFENNSYLYVRLTSNEIGDGSGSVYNFNQLLPQNKKQKDYLIDTIREFNLWLTPDKTVNNKIIIEPYIDWFNAGADDWTSLRDISKGEIHKPMGSLEHLRYVMKHKEDNDYYNKKYNEDTNYVYGQAIQDIDNDFLKSDNTTELSYSPTVSVGHTTNGLIIPKILTYDNGVIKPIKHNVRSMLWGGLVAMDGGYWNLRSLGSVEVKTSYPYVGHLDTPYNPTFDFLFDNPSQIYWERPALNYTDNNLYNKYWKPYINQLIDKNSRVVERYYYLNERAINNLNIRKRIFDDGEYYILTKIEDFRVDGDQSVKCELLKLIDYTPFISGSISYGGGGGTGSGSMGSARSASIAGSFLAESVDTSSRMMRLAGNIKTKFVTINSDSELPKEPFTTILADASGGTITITLNDVGFEFTIIRIDNTVGQTVDLISNDATGTVDFVTTYSMTNQGESVVVVPNGINFYLKK